MNVTLYQRCPLPGCHSIERIADTLVRAMPPGITVRVARSRYPSRGAWPRLYNLLEAMGRQGDVNHIAGDVHYLALGLSRRRTLLTIHDCVQLRRVAGLRRWLLWLFWFRLPAWRCARLVAISEATRREVCARLSRAPETVTVIPDPLPEGYVPCPRPFRSDCPVLLQVRTTPHKNLERVAEALVGIPCRLRIVGRPDASQQAVLERCRIAYSAAADLSDAEMLEEYRRCDAVLMVSTYEGFGMPIIEGQAVGRPVIAGNVCSMPEVAGGAACLVDPFDVAGIRAGVLRVTRDEAYRASLIERGYANVERFRPERIARQYAALYEEMLRS